LRLLNRQNQFREAERQALERRRLRRSKSDEGR